MSQPHSGSFQKEDGIGLLVAIVLHALLVAALAVQFLFTATQKPIPQRMTVSLATEVSLESTAPDPVAESRAAIAPTLSEEPAPIIEEVPQNTPAEVTPPPTPRPETRSTTRTEPRPATRTPPRAQPSPQPTRTSTPTPPRERPGGSRIGDNFLGGAGNSTTTDDTRIPASQIGRSARASLQQAINRQLRPYWDAPSGLDAEQLVTVLAFRLNEDGSLNGTPRVVSQSGITDSNRPQAPLHAERAIRAVQRAAPFDLPDEYYNAWKNISEWRFDRRL
ncbi:energy transducer TonB [Erythrobacter sp. SCSIO 43205]|uniref:TonB C-terminal domain-containing protein n=1 Tax=Erythrobacter sp. SCSIO 43205 TaxID=2779361 RepID=UPI001CAA2157|nr:energy transducer TonB [Erythrobacter sp. SCSIO 43205]UAB77751.1 energy transducer TonB [Erythrobacter sp. SCSIO 43205]